MAQIKFIQMTQATYNSLDVANKLSTNIYFTSDTLRIYKGAELYSQDVKILTEAPTVASELFDGVLYVVSSNGDMYIKSGNEIKQVGGKSQEIARLSSSVSANTSSITSLDDRLKTAEDQIDALSAIGDVGQFTQLVAGKLNKTDFNAYSSTTAETLATLRTDVNANETAISSNTSEIAGVKSSITTLTTNSAVTVDDTATPGQGIAKVYTIKQGNVAVGTINIPKDLVVTSGSVVVAGDGTNGTQVISGATAGDKYIKLTVANQTAPIYIAVKDLVDVYTAQQDATEVQLTIGNNNEISATIVDGSIAKSKLATAVQTSLGKADTALQSGSTYYADIKVIENGDTLAVDMNGIKNRITDLESFQSSSTANINSLIDAKIAELDSQSSAAAGKFINSITMVDGKITAIGQGEYTLSSGSANGTVSYNGTDVAVTGLKSAAYAESTAFDAAGAAAGAKADVTGTASDAAGTLTLNGLSKSIAILNNADASVAGSVANQVATASSQAVTTANSYTDNAISEALAWEVYDQNGDLVTE